MTKHDAARRAFLVRAAVGAGAVAGAGLVPDLDAQMEHNKPETSSSAAHTHPSGAEHGAFFNHDDAATMAAGTSLRASRLPAAAQSAPAAVAAVPSAFDPVCAAGGPLRPSTKSCRYAACGVPASAAARAVSARAPAARAWSICGPNAGSVMFCVATTPAPARACAQRAATAGEDDAMAIPNNRASCERATRENVTARLDS